MLRFIIFDVMGVVFTVGDDVEELLIPYIRALKLGIDAQEIRNKYLEASLARITAQEFWAQLGFREENITKLERAYLEKSFTLDAEFRPCVEALRKRYGIALLSNDIAEWSRFLRVHYNLEPLLDAAFISGDLGVRKPDPQIYRIALATLGAKPHECVFIDDDPVRVAAAAELGFRSILFNRADRDYGGEQIESFRQIERLLT